MVNNRIKYNVGIWSFGANATRFLSEGHHLDLKKLSTPEKIELLSENLSDLIDGLEFHYPTELNYNNIDSIIEKSNPNFDIYIIALGFHSMQEFINGSFTNPDKEIRKLAIKLSKETIDLCAKTGAIHAGFIRRKCVYLKALYC